VKAETDRVRAALVARLPRAPTRPPSAPDRAVRAFRAALVRLGGAEDALAAALAALLAPTPRSSMSGPRPRASASRTSALRPADAVGRARAAVEASAAARAAAADDDGSGGAGGSAETPPPTTRGASPDPHAPPSPASPPDPFAPSPFARPPPLSPGGAGGMSALVPPWVVASASASAAPRSSAGPADTATATTTAKAATAAAAAASASGGFIIADGEAPAPPHAPLAPWEPDDAPAHPLPEHRRFLRAGEGGGAGAARPGARGGAGGPASSSSYARVGRDSGVARLGVGVVPPGSGSPLRRRPPGVLNLDLGTLGRGVGGSGGSSGGRCLFAPPSLGPGGAVALATQLHAHRLPGERPEDALQSPRGSADGTTDGGDGDGHGADNASARAVRSATTRGGGGLSPASQRGPSEAAFCADVVAERLRTLRERMERGEGLSSGAGSPASAGTPKRAPLGGADGDGKDPGCLQALPAPESRGAASVAGLISAIRRLSGLRG